LSWPSRSRDARRVRRVPQGRRDRPDHTELKANKVPRGLKAQKVTKVVLGLKDPKAQRANKVPRDRKGHKAQKANKVFGAPWVKQAQLPPGQQDYMRSSWINVIAAPVATSNAARAKNWFR
jgi:hypothetical protein